MKLQLLWLMAECFRAALLNARAPHRVVVFGSISKWAPADLSDRVGKYSCRRSAMYSGASPFSVLYTWMSSLYCILCSTGSQCRFIRTGLVISDACTGDRTCRDVLALLQLGDRVTGQTSEQSVVKVQARRNEGMDNFLARIAVEESPDFSNVSDMVALLKLSRVGRDTGRDYSVFLHRGPPSILRNS